MAQLKLKGILSYPHLFTPRSVNPGDDPKYSTAILFRKDDPQVQQILQVIETEKANGFPSGFPPTGKVCLKDGATDPNFSQDPMMHNYYILNTNNSDKPQVVDMNLQPLMDPSQVYAGCVAWVSVGIQAYNKPVNKGVGAYINGVMPTGEEGELGRIDGRPTAQQMFGDVAGQGVAPVAPPGPGITPPGMPAPAAPAPVPPMPPAAPAAPAAPAPAELQMTAAANGMTAEQYFASGWTEQMLIDHGLAIRPSFA